jgi:hypothetical protein
MICASVCLTRNVFFPLACLAAAVVLGLHTRAILALLRLL